jgi:hypothetical protein
MKIDEIKGDSGNRPRERVFHGYSAEVGQLGGHLCELRLEDVHLLEIQL